MIYGFECLLPWSMFGGFRQRNEYFDYMFYDTGSLTDAERLRLTQLDKPEGSLIVVSPGDSTDNIREYGDIESFLAAEADRVRAVVVAGVGSSVVGTAALARNAANVYGFDVVGLVSGNGAGDLITEAFGGRHFFGAGGPWSQHWHFGIDNFDALFRVFPLLPRIDLHRGQRRGLSLQQVDMWTLLGLLTTPALQLELVVGHSKGSLMLDFALDHFVRGLDGRSHEYFDRLAVVTLGAVSRFPAEFTRVRQFLGEIDWFGSMHSRTDVDRHTLPGAWHHLNTQLPCHLSAETALRELVPI